MSQILDTTGETGLHTCVQFTLLQDLSFFLKLKLKVADSGAVPTGPVFFQQVYRRLQVRTCHNILLLLPVSLGRLSGVFTAVFKDYQTDKVQPPGPTSQIELQAWV